MTWPTKTDFVDGDVLTASQVNNIGTNLNEFDPTGITAGYVLTADGAGSVNWAGAGGTIVQAVQATVTSGNVSTSGTTDVSTGLSVTITPTSVANKLFFVSTTNFSIAQTSSSNQHLGRVRLKDNTAGTFISQGNFGGQSFTYAVNEKDWWAPGLTAQYTPPNTSARTFELFFRAVYASLYIVELQASATEPAFFSVFEVAYT